MSIKDCSNCNGAGWLPKGYKDANWHPAPHVPEGLPPAELWEPCWCSFGKIAEGQPAFWKDKERVRQVFFCSHEDLEQAVSSFLNRTEPHPQQVKLLKFYIAQWVSKDFQPPTEWLEKLARCNDWKSLNDYTTWLEGKLIAPF